MKLTYHNDDSAAAPPVSLVLEVLDGVAASATSGAASALLQALPPYRDDFTLEENLLNSVHIYIRKHK